MTGWARSSRCAAGDCVEARAVTVNGQPRIWLRLVRGGRPQAAFTSLTRAEWDAFTAGIKDGDFDQLTGETP